MAFLWEWEVFCRECDWRHPERILGKPLAWDIAKRHSDDTGHETEGVGHQRPPKIKPKAKRPPKQEWHRPDLSSVEASQRHRRLWGLVEARLERERCSRERDARRIPLWDREGTQRWIDLYRAERAKRVFPATPLSDLKRIRPSRLLPTDGWGPWTFEYNHGLDRGFVDGMADDGSLFANLNDRCPIKRGRRRFAWKDGYREGWRAGQQLVKHSA